MSRRLPAVKPKEVLRALGRAGFFIHHTLFMAIPEAITF
jgi:hypothetical protein